MVEIERAINYWCTQEPAGPDGALCARACVRSLPCTTR
ncbi:MULTISPECIES: DUF3717 domain-containing protein [Paraburkholderia]